MDFYDSIGYLIIFGVMLVQIRHRSLKTRGAYHPPKVNIDEPDVSRWRHDGTQNFKWRTGNRAPENDEVAQALSTQIFH